MKNKKKIVIILICIILLLGIGYYIYKINTVKFSLVGEETITIEYGSLYDDSGVVAETGFGKDLSDNVQVVNNVDSLSPGTYKIIYLLNYQNQQKTIERTVIVQELQISDLEIRLNGEKELFILKDTDYEEKGAVVYNKLTETVFAEDDISITENINTSVAGEYGVNYTYHYQGKSITSTRKVSVLDLQYKITPDNFTTGKVTIILNANSINNCSYIELPDNTKSSNKEVRYEVNSNSNYLFTIGLTNGQVLRKNIEIDNIIKNYTCTGEITTTGTKLKVNQAGSEIKGYSWITKNETVNGGSTYNKNKIISSARVSLTFANNKSYEVNCSITDNLLYRFTYDLKNTGTWTKPEMQCNTYTAADRTKLENLLKKAIAAAGGKGTRGGVVEAARFMVGGLDYRVRYQGPKSTDSRVGRYAHEGLNIGNSSAWGCRVGGYTQGMDCTHFIEWVLYQNGITQGAYTFPRSETSKVINKLKPGDLVYVKCGKSCANPSAGLSHVGIIVGIDGDTYYIAESVPGKDGKLGVTMHATSKETLLKAYTLIGNIPFKGEGNVTDMWMME